MFSQAFKSNMNQFNLNNNSVSFCFSKADYYPNKAPYHPDEKYPEILGTELDSENGIYECVRNTLISLRMDFEHIGTKKWNPFQKIIKPGMTVFIKPNTCTHEHLLNKDIFSAIIHASVLRPILDYVCIALNNDGKIIIGDSQLIYADYQNAMEQSGINALLEWYRKRTPVQIECLDLRTVRTVRSWLYGRWKHQKINNDKSGYEYVDLKKESCFNNIDPLKLRVAIASYKEMQKHHTYEKHEYLIPKSLLKSDVVISIPKLKTHRRTAVTLALKNFMGISAGKDCIPHFQTGSVKEGGDQYINPSIRKRIGTHLHDIVQSSPYIPVKFVAAILKKLIWNSSRIIPFKDDVFEAMWYGNDTVWRTLHDLNRIVFFADKNGKMSNSQQRGFFCLIDGIIAGEKDGPLSPDPVNTGVILAGFNPFAIDTIASTLMGFDYKKIPLIMNGLNKGHNGTSLFKGTEDDILVCEKNERYNIQDLLHKKCFRFEPHPNWKGYVELNN